MIKLKAQAYSVMGSQHTKNDDAIFINQDERIFIISDGVSDGGQGRFASNLVTRLLSERLLEANQVFQSSGEVMSYPKRLHAMAEVLQSAFIDAQGALKAEAKQNPDFRSASCTCIAVWFHGRFAILGHIGDSRAYLSRAGKVQQLTKDHTGYHEMLKMGFTPEAASKSPLARGLTRAMGKAQLNQADFLKIEFQSGDTLVLCTDGFYSSIEKQAKLNDFVSDFENDLKIEPWVEGSAKSSGDDSSVVSVHFEEHADAQVTDRKMGLRAAERIELVRNTPLSRYLDYFQKAHVAAICEMERFKAGATVLSEGDEGAWMYVVASGTLTVSKNGKFIRKAGPGDFLGEIALIQNTKRGATVVAEGDVVLLSLMRSDLEEVFKKDPQIETQFYKSMLENALEKVVELTDKIESASRGI